MNKASEDCLNASNAAKEKISLVSSGNPGLVDVAVNFVEKSLSGASGQHYKAFDPACLAIVNEINLRCGPKGVKQFLILVISQAVLRTLASGSFEKLSPRIINHQLKQINRILIGLHEGADWLDINSDFFHKEFGLASLRLYAAAAQVVDPNCGLPRSTVIKSGVSGALRGARYILECGGFSPMFQIHTHSMYLDEFDEEGWNECYRCCADLYLIFPEVKGMFGGSWFYDPNLLEISPRLAYLQKVPLEGGAATFFTAKEGGHVQNSIATSPTRRQLYESGRYHPLSYTLVWSKTAQVRWAHGNSP